MLEERRSLVSMRWDGFRLDIRRSVAIRERNLSRGILFYLSLLEEEIDERCERFVDGRNSDSEDLTAAALQLELTDAVIIHRRDGTTEVMRGGSCTFPLFWKRCAMGFHLTTALPLAAGESFSRAGLASAMAVVCLQGSYEPNAYTETPLLAWRRVRRGATTVFSATGKFDEYSAFDHPETGGAVEQEDVIAARVSSAFSAYTTSQRAVTSSVLELSGGFDSTLAGAAALGPGHTMLGVSAEFPYYEFRFESAAQKAVGSALGISRTVLDGTQMFPYCPWENPPRFDEPSVFVTGIRHAEVVAGFAARHHATRIYMGHGGDQLFSTDLTGAETAGRPADKALFSARAWRAFQQTVQRIREPLWLQRSTGCFVYDARQDIWIKETFGTTIRTPFSDLAIFRAAQMWSRWSASRGARPDKTILAHAMGDLLPDAVVQRKGKVAYDGVWMRAYAAHQDHIAKTFERASAVLEYVGISPKWLLRRVGQLAEWRQVSDREVLAGYAIAVWLLSWGIERIADVSWDDFS